MRTDHGFYIVAVICFIIAASPFYYPSAISEEFTRVALTVIFAALGLMSIILGYSLRPKPIISTLEAHEPALSHSTPPTLSPPEEATVAPPSEPTPPTPPQEETAKPEKEKPKAKTRRKRTKRRRKKT